MTIIRKQSDIEGASNADLLETYNAMTGKSVKKFSSRAAAELQTSNALLAAVDAAGHLGVAKGKKAEPMTATELEIARAARGALGMETTSRSDRFSGPLEVSAPRAVAAAKTGDKSTLRAKLAAKAGGEPNKPKPKAERTATRARAPKIEAVVPTYAGVSKLQAESQRKGVYDGIVALFEAKANKLKPVTVEALEAHMGGLDVRPYIFKLAQRNHVTITPAADAK